MPGNLKMATFDACRKKRNLSSYDSAGAISSSEADEMIQLAQRIRREVARWIVSVHPQLMKKES
jgi:hypothetical protein